MTRFAFPSVSFDSVAPARLIRWFSQPASPAELPVSSLFQPFPRSQFALRANLRLLYLPPCSLCPLWLNLLVPVSKNSDFHFPGERSISWNERQITTPERLKLNCKTLVYNASDLTTQISSRRIFPKVQPPPTMKKLILLTIITTALGLGSAAHANSWGFQLGNGSGFYYNQGRQACAVPHIHIFSENCPFFP